MAAFFLLLLVGLVIFVIVQVRENEKKEREATRLEEITKQYQRDRENQQEAEQLARLAALRKDVESLVARANAEAAYVGAHLRDANSALNRAEREFSDGAFAPFWDAVEVAANKVASANRCIETAAKLALDFQRRSKDIPDNRPEWIIVVDAIPATTSTAARMHRIVRAAQRNFQFATIYEQRKTNQLLVSGFGNLAQAISSMEERVVSSIDSLSGALDQFSGQSEYNADRIREAVQTLDGSLAEHFRVQDERIERQTEMLDNIQRRRKPRYQVYPRTFT